MEKYLKQLQLHFPNGYGNGNFVSNLRENMINLKDNSSSLTPVKAHAFESVTFSGKNGFEPLKATCKMACICCR